MHLTTFWGKRTGMHDDFKSIDSMHHLSKSFEITKCNLVNTDPNPDISCYVHLLLHRRNEPSIAKSGRALDGSKHCRSGTIPYTVGVAIGVMENMFVDAFRLSLMTEEVFHTMVHHIITVTRTTGLDDSPPRTHPTSPSITSTSFEPQVRRSFHAVLSADYKDARGKV
jgi:hypothetical protein